MYNKEYMGAMKQLYQEQQEIKQESREILAELLESYSPELILKKMQKLQEELLNE